MKKGDIVQFAEESDLSWAAGNMEAYHFSQRTKFVDVPNNLTVKEVIPKLYCFGIDDGIEFEEIPGSWKERGFKILHSAKGPDLITS